MILFTGGRHQQRRIARDEAGIVVLGVWEWRQDGLYFVGATQDTQIRLRYQKSFPDFTDGTNVVLIRNAQEAIAYSRRSDGGCSARFSAR